MFIGRHGFASQDSYPRMAQTVSNRRFD